jgi:hypothetical protein
MRTLIAIASILTSTSFAQSSSGFEIPKTVEIPAYTVEDGGVDIAGFRPSMPAEEALELLREHTAGKELRYLEGYFGTRDVRSVYYPTAYYSWSEPEEINVLLNSPSAGNQVVSVSRSLSFRRDQRPLSEDVMASLIEKYGEPQSSFRRNAQTRAFSWYLGGNRQCELKHLDVGMSNVSGICDEPLHATGPGINNLTYSPQRAQYYLDTAAGASNVVLVASLTEYREDGKTDRLVVSFIDLHRRAASVQADIGLLNAEQEKFNSVKVDVPKL